MWGKKKVQWEIVDKCGDKSEILWKSRACRDFYIEPRTEHSNPMYYVYLLKDRKKGTTYIGYSEDLRRRLKEHKQKDPELIYYEAYKNEIDARNREKKLKQRGQAIRHLKERIKYSLI